MGDTITERKEWTSMGTTITVTVEVSDDGHLSDEARVEAAIALLEEGLNTDAVDWDHNHPVPTFDNRVI